MDTKKNQVLYAAHIRYTIHFCVLMISALKAGCYSLSQRFENMRQISQGTRTVIKIKGHAES